MGLIKRNKIEDKGEILLKTDIVGIIPEEKDYSHAHEDEYEGFGSHEERLSGSEISEAEINAREIINSAKREAQEIKAKAHDEGINKGRAEASQKIKEALETLNQAVIERKKIIKDSESEILRLAIKAAEQVIRSEVSLHRDVSLNIVSEAINRVSDREQVIIRVNREDAEFIKRYKDRLSSIVDGVKSFSILEDGSIEPGGCVIETNLGFVDARISTKLQAIEDALKKAHEEGEDH